MKLKVTKDMIDHAATSKPALGYTKAQISYAQSLTGKEKWLRSMVGMEIEKQAWDKFWDLGSKLRNKNSIKLRIPARTNPSRLLINQSDPERAQKKVNSDGIDVAIKAIARLEERVVELERVIAHLDQAEHDRDLIAKSSKFN